MKYMFLFFSLCFFISTVFGTIYQANNNGNKLLIDCDQSNLCKLRATNQQNNKIIKISGHALAIDKTNFIWDSSDLVELKTGIGSGVAYSRFFSFNKMQLSDLFFNVSYINTQKNIIFIQSNKNSTYFMACIFNPSIALKIILNNGILDFGAIQSISNNQVKFGYYDDHNNYQYKTINLDLNCGN